MCNPPCSGVDMEEGRRESEKEGMEGETGREYKGIGRSVKGSNRKGGKG